jgi:hypothetical protein
MRMTAKKSAKQFAKGYKEGKPMQMQSMMRCVNLFN